MDSGVDETTRNTVIHADLTWEAFVNKRKVPAASQLLINFPSPVNSPNMVQDMLTTLDQAALCPKNLDPDLVFVCERRGSVMRNSRGNGEIVADLDHILSSVTVDNSASLQFKELIVSCSAQTLVLIPRVATFGRSSAQPSALLSLG